jgi:hypothetical protein
MNEERDPYRLSDVYLRWEPDYGLEWLDEDEWGAAESDWDALTRGMTTQARSRLRRYLAMNGAAVWKRIDPVLADARGNEDRFPAGALVAATTAAELLIRFLLFRPMYASLVFNTKLAMRLAREGPSTAPVRDRKLLPDVCRAWGVDLDALVLPNGQELWRTLEALIGLRHQYVHRAVPIVAEQAHGAIDCVDGLVDLVVKPLVRQAGLGWPPSEWTHNGRTHDPIESTYEYMGS